MNYIFIRQQIFRIDTKFGIGSLFIAVLLIKCLASLTFGSGFDKFLVSIHIGLAIVGLTLCLWGYMEGARSEKIENEGRAPGISEDSDTTSQT